MAILDIFKSKTADTAAPESPSATDVLKEGHDTVRGLFKEFRSAGDRAYKDKARLFTEIDRELSVHARIEEEIFYPAVKASRGEDAEKEVLEAQEEHTVVKRLLAELKNLGPQDETFDAKMKVLMEGVEHHADEEEDDMFSTAREALGEDRLKELGARLQERKEQLMKNPSSLGETGTARRSPRAARKPASESGSGQRSRKKATPAGKRGAAKASRSARGERARSSRGSSTSSSRGKAKKSATRGASSRTSKKSSSRSRAGKKGSRR
jgi:hemerythrin superfamily protein